MTTMRRDPYRPASADSVDQLARELAILRRSARRPQLTHSAIDDGALVTTVKGQTTAIVGQQWDGTSGAVVIAGPTPPTPSAPGVTTEPGGIKVRWDGTFPDQPGYQLPVVAPGDFKGVEVQVSPNPAFPQGDTAQAFDLVVGTLITSARGGDVFVPWGDAGTPLYARLVVRAVSGKGSAPSAVTGPVSAGSVGEGGVDDGIAPKAPTGLTLMPGTTMGKDGHEQGYVIAQWEAPTENEDGSALHDLAGHLVHWKPASGTVWQSTVTTETSINLTAAPNQSHQVRVAAFDKVNNFSPWTSTGSVTVVADTTAPAQPSVPVVSNYLGQLRIFWDGLLAGGTAPPVDFNRLDVHVAGTSGFTPVAGTLVSSLATRGYAFATNPYGVDAYVKFVAYDNSGNASTSSAQAVGTTSQVVDRDIFAGAVGKLQLADLAVTNAKIDLLAVNDIHVANVNVGKLVSGTMSASVVLSGRFTTASTGARVEHNALGFQGFRSDNSKWLSLTNTEALITATIMTATTGRRMVFGAGGTAGTIDFYAPDGKRGFVRGFTESTGVESLQIGQDAPSGNNYLWNRINVNNIGITSYQAGRHIMSVASPQNAGAGEWAVEFFPDQTVYNAVNPAAHGGVRRLVILNDLFQYRSYDDQVRFRIQSSANRVSFYPRGETTGRGSMEIVGNGGVSASTDESAKVEFRQPNGGGMLLKTYQDVMEVRRVEHPGVGHDQVFGSLRLWDLDAAGEVRAKGVVLASDRSGKGGVRDWTGSATDGVKTLRPRWYTRDRAPGEPPAREELGLVAQEAPPEIVVTDPAGTLGIDLYAYVTLLAKGLQEALTRLEALETRPGRPA